MRWSARPMQGEVKSRGGSVGGATGAAEKGIRDEGMSRPKRPASRQEEDVAEAVRFGCPMLYRARTIPAPGVPPMRCHLGWALHNQEEIERYLRVFGSAGRVRSPVLV